MFFVVIRIDSRGVFGVSGVSQGDAEHEFEFVAVEDTGPVGPHEVGEAVVEDVVVDFAFGVGDGKRVFFRDDENNNNNDDNSKKEKSDK